MYDTLGLQYKYKNKTEITKHRLHPQPKEKYCLYKRAWAFGYYALFIIKMKA
jgi:hypothetical protein